MGLWQMLGGRVGFLRATGILLLIGIAYLFAVSPFVSAQGENPATGELETDDPPVSFRVTGQGDDWIGVAWEVPRDRGLTNYVLQRYRHDGSQYVSEGSAGRIDGVTNGGAGHAQSSGALEPDTQYRYTLELKNAAAITIIEASATGRTLTEQPPASSDATLSGLTLSGISLSFNSETTDYTAQVANSVTQTTLAATTSDTDAFYTVIAGGFSYGTLTPISLKPGENIISVRVVAADGETRKTYTVTVTRAWPPATLSSLSLTGVSLSFAWDTTEYTAEVVNGLEQTTVTATAGDEGGTYQVKLNGVVDADGMVPLAVGENVITIEVSSADGNTARTYTVTVTRVEALSTDATLSALGISGSPLWNEPFDPATERYTVHVANTVSEVTVTATLTVVNAGARYLIRIGGVVDADGVVPLGVGQNVITVQVIAPDRRTSKTYTVTLTRLAGALPTLGELETDDPPVSFRVTGQGDDWIGVAWEVPRDRGLTNYVLQRYRHDGAQFVESTGYLWSVENATNGGAGHAQSSSALEPDTQYRYTLKLKNTAGIAIIETSVTGRTDPAPVTATDGETEPSPEDLPAPSNVQVIGGANAGEVIITWDEVAGADYYRVGWVSYAHYLAVTGEGRDWLEAFTFVDVINRGQKSHEISDLEDGARYAFLVASNGSRFGEPQWSEWVILVLSDADASAPVIGELETDDPAVDLQVAGYGDDWAAVQWAVPGGRGITKYILQRLEHDGTEFVSPGIPQRIQGNVSDGSRVSWSDVNLTPDSEYRYTLILANAADIAIIEKSVTLRTLQSPSPPSPRVILSSLVLSDVPLQFDWATTRYTAEVANGVSQTIVTPTVNHTGASYQVKLNGVVDADGVVPLAVGRNILTVEVTVTGESSTGIYTVVVTRAETPSEDTSTTEQSSIPAPGNVRASDGPTSGEAIVAWNAVAEANYYRIGWVSYDRYLAVTGAGQDWLEAFNFIDVANRSQTTHTVGQLTPGTLYAFIVASNTSRFGAPQWGEWARLTLASASR